MTRKSLEAALDVILNCDCGSRVHSLHVPIDLSSNKDGTGRNVYDSQAPNVADCHSFIRLIRAHSLDSMEPSPVERAQMEARYFTQLVIA